MSSGGCLDISGWIGLQRCRLIGLLVWWSYLQSGRGFRRCLVQNPKEIKTRSCSGSDIRHLQGQVGLHICELVPYCSQRELLQEFSNCVNINAGLVIRKTSRL